MLVNAVTTSELKRKIEQTQNAKNKTKAELEASKNKKQAAAEEADKLQNQINEVDGNINQLDSIIYNSNVKIEQINIQLAENEKQLNDTNNKLKKRIRVIYENGNSSYIEILFQSSNFGEFLERISLLGDVIRHDRAIMIKINEQKKQRALKKAALEKGKQEINEAQKLAEAQRSELSTIFVQKDRMVAQLQSDVAGYEKKLREQEAAEDALNELLREQIRIEQQKNKRVYAGGQCAWPVPAGGTITSSFGYRTDPYPGFHKGIDIAAGFGSTIVAANSGVVISVGYEAAGYGSYVVIDHGGGLATLYAHLSRIGVGNGQSVDRGQSIGAMGSSGLSTGSHLHFETILNGQNVNPLGYVN